jgi:hypothetical protein
MKPKKNSKIFVQIASYRDPQLIPTIKNMLENAKNPKNITIGIARQFHPDDKFDDLSEYENDDRFRILNIPYQEAEGVCWARHLVQQLYKDEAYTLQIDSHMRFAPDWDEEMINMVKQLQKKGHKKPLLTGYISSFDPDNDPNGRIEQPWKMNFDRFIPEGAVFFLPATIDDYKERTEPLRARFYSAHFCFTLGSFVKEVPHDPEYYFHGEEISIAVRAYTWGYDLFHPHKIIAWHEYTRKGRKKQWDDDSKWVTKNVNSHRRNRKLFGMDGEVKDIDFGIYDFGKERSLEDYERYSGLSFKKRAVQQYTVDNKYPPNPPLYGEDFDKSFLQIFKHCVDIGFDKIPLTDYEFFVVAFHDENDETIFRKDADVNEIKTIKNDSEGYGKIWREFQTDKKPKYWVVWPYSTTNGWCERITGDL